MKITKTLMIYICFLARVLCCDDSKSREGKLENILFNSLIVYIICTYIVNAYSSRLFMYCFITTKSHLLNWLI